MSFKNMVIAALVGGITAFVVGFLAYGILLTDFFAKNAGSASGVMRPDQDLDYLSLIIGHLFMGALLAYIYERWARIQTLKTGAIAGTVIFALIALAQGFVAMGTTYTTTWSAVVVDVLVVSIMGAIVGSVVGWMLGRLD